MPNVFFISDLHLFHSNILKFKKADGSLTRPGFRDLHHMHAVIGENWCRTVKAEDKVYVLGDVTFHQDGLKLMRGWPGHKRLVRGNHDLLRLKEYASVFEEIYGVRQLDRYWLTHVPMHPHSMERAIANIHGHLHTNVIRDLPFGQPNPRYVNVCVEQIDYTPIEWSEIRKRFE